MAEVVRDVDAVSPYNPRVIYGVSTTLMVLSAFIVALRFYVRRHYRIGYGYDDWTILMALIIGTGTGITVILASAIGGMGDHQQLGPNGEMIHTQALYNYEKCRYAIGILSCLNLGIVKSSIVLFYQRLFTTRAFKITSRVMIGLLILWTLAITFASMLSCRPISVYWTNFEIDFAANCMREDILFVTITWTDVALDVLVITLPLPIICFLHLPWRKKIAIIDVLALGLIVLGSGIPRAVVLLVILRQSARDYFYDVTFWSSGVVFWCFAENSIAIVGACLPTLAPLWARQQSQECKNSAKPVSVNGKDHHVRPTPPSANSARSHAGWQSFPSLSGPRIEVHTTISVDENVK